jgi:hypothetical protein
VIGPGAWIIAAALATGSPAEGPGPSIRWELDPSGRASAVSVLGLEPESLAALRGARWPADRWPVLLSVTIDEEAARKADRPSMLGSYRVDGEVLRFTPRYPFDRGRRYRATLRPSNIPGVPGGSAEFSSVHLEPKPARPSTVVTRVTPSSDRLPENLLKFYLHFSSPMGRGEVYDRVRLLKDDGKAVDAPFLRLGEELWDPTGTRLTLLIDPGRIKRGLKPREEFGPVLEAGRTYSLVIDPAWRDAEGDPLGAEYRKTFRAGPEDETQPDPKTWTIHRPGASTRDPLTLAFPEALDSALLESALILVDARGQEVDGRVELEAGEARWRFTPDAPWVAGDYQLLVDDELEDQVGNSIRRRFEVDVQRDTPVRPESRVIRLPIAIRGPGR